MTRVQLKALLLQVRLHVLAIGAAFGVNGCFDDYTRCMFVGRLRNLKVNVTVAWIHTRVLKICKLYLDQLQVASEARLGGRQDGRLGPGENGIDSDLHGCTAGDGNMFRGVTVIGNIRQHGKAVAKVFKMAEYAAGLNAKNQQAHRRFVTVAWMHSSPLA